MKKLQIKILTLNIHKGFSSFNRKFVLRQLKEAMRDTEADLVFLQEVTGKNQKNQKKYEDWPEASHYEFLADEIWSEFAYGKNAVYPKGHHGNAILSRYPIVESENIDITTNRLEDRGFLYARVEIPKSGMKLHCICVHLGLWSKSRAKQMNMIRDFISSKIPLSEPLLLAGDFNDWSQRSVRTTVEELDLDEVFLQRTGKHVKTFPSWMPIFRLDRIYARSVQIIDCEAHDRRKWAKLTDHLPLIAHVAI